MSDEKDLTPAPEAETDTGDETAPAPPVSRFPELESLQQDIERRIRDNHKFLERFLDDDYVDEDAIEEDDEAPEDFEEL